MNRIGYRPLSMPRYASILLGLAGLFVSVYFLGVSVKTENVQNDAEANLVLGRLAFSRRITQVGQEEAIVTSNPDGTGHVTIGFLGLSNLSFDPVWSPDGTKIAFGVATSSLDIWSANADGSGTVNLTNTGFDARETNPSWSSTGKIAYERRVDQFSSPQIWTMNADGTGQGIFAGITQPSPTGPAWSPDGSKLAFASGGGIWVINADGTNQVRLTNGSDPAWSADGSRIVFSSGGIVTINPDGTNATPLTNSNDTQPAWSPDGAKIAFKRNAAPSGIYTMDADGGNPLIIVPDSTTPFPAASVSYWSPTWQPVAQTPASYIISGHINYNGLPASGITVDLRGTTNATTTTDAVGYYQFSGLQAAGNFTVSPGAVRHYIAPAKRSFFNLNANQFGNNFDVLGVCFGGRCARNGKIAYGRGGEIYTINANGTGEANVTNNAATDWEPHWLPDGVGLAFSTNRDGNFEIYRMNSEGDPNPTRLTNNTARDTSPFYSPDGTTIVFVSDRDGNGEIYKMNADGSNQVRLTNRASDDFQPAFSPDGRKIIFATVNSGPAKLYTMNADGSDQQPLPDSNSVLNYYERPSFSPDGNKIIFTYSNDISTGPRLTYTMNADGTNRQPFPADGRGGIYSPDGFKVTYTCCNFNNTDHVLTANSNGSSVRSLTTVTGNEVPHWQGFYRTRAPFDFDGDGRSDLSYFRSSNRGWYLLRSTEGLWVPQWGLATDVLAPGDYDGDLKTDVAVWRPSDGNFYVLNSFDSTVRIENFGLTGDVPTGGDWDGDGKTDVAVYRPGSQSYFYYRASMGNPQRNISSVPWGITGDKPVVGDYDGDARSDPAVYRNGIWYVRQSSNGELAARHFGLADDVLIPADYDGDGKTDVAVYRLGVWYLMRSLQGFTAFQFGLAADVPAPADYDGDGRADVTIFRNGAWWMRKSQTGAVEVAHFGTGGDQPIPSVFVR